MTRPCWIRTQTDGDEYLTVDSETDEHEEEECCKQLGDRHRRERLRVDDKHQARTCKQQQPLQTLHRGMPQIIKRLHVIQYGGTSIPSYS